MKKVALAIIEDREEAQVENYVRGLKGDIKTILNTIERLKSTEMKSLCKKVMFKTIKESSDCRSIGFAIEYYKVDVNGANALYEACVEKLTKLPISDALDEIENLESEKIAVKGLEKLIVSTKGEDALKVVDFIFRINSELATELREKIPYNEEALKRMTLNSTNTFSSLKLTAIQLRSYL